MLLKICGLPEGAAKMTFLEFLATAFLSAWFASKQEERRDVEESRRLKNEIGARFRLSGRVANGQETTRRVRGN